MNRWLNENFDGLCIIVIIIVLLNCLVLNTRVDELKKSNQTLKVQLEYCQKLNKNK